MAADLPEIQGWQSMEEGRPFFAAAVVEISFGKSQQPGEHCMKTGDGGSGVIRHFVGLRSGRRIENEVAAAIQRPSATEAGEVLIVFVEEAKTAADKRNVLMDVPGRVALGLQHHQTEFQYRIPFIFQPVVVFNAFVESGGSVPSVFGRIGKAEIFQLLRETGAAMAPVDGGAELGVVEKAEIEFELREHQIEVA